MREQQDRRETDPEDRNEIPLSAPDHHPKINSGLCFVAETIPRGRRRRRRSRRRSGRGLQRAADCDHLGERRLLRHNRGSKIAVQCLCEVQDVLNDERLIEPERVPESPQRIGRCVITEDVRRGIAWYRAHQKNTTVRIPMIVAAIMSSRPPM